MGGDEDDEQDEEKLEDEVCDNENLLESKFN